MALEHFTSSIKHDIEYIIGWESMTATGTGSLVLIDAVTADRCSRKNCVQKCTFCSDSDKCYKTDRQSFTVQMVNDPKHTTKPGSLKEKEMAYSLMTNESPDLTPREHNFQM